MVVLNELLVETPENDQEKEKAKRFYWKGKKVTENALDVFNALLPYLLKIQTIIFHPK